MFLYAIEILERGVLLSMKASRVSFDDTAFTDYTILALEAP